MIELIFNSYFFTLRTTQILALGNMQSNHSLMTGQQNIVSDKAALEKLHNIQRSQLRDSTPSHLHRTQDHW